MEPQPQEPSNIQKSCQVACLSERKTGHRKNITFSERHHMLWDTQCFHGRPHAIIAVAMQLHAYNKDKCVEIN